jgi:fructose-1,6-bisphosphatase
VKDHVSGHAASLTAMVVDRLHILDPPIGDRGPLTHTVC